MSANRLELFRGVHQKTRGLYVELEHLAQLFGDDLESDDLDIVENARAALKALDSVLTARAPELVRAGAFNVNRTGNGAINTRRDA